MACPHGKPSWMVCPKCNPQLRNIMIPAAPMPPTTPSPTPATTPTRIVSPRRLPPALPQTRLPAQPRVVKPAVAVVRGRMGRQHFQAFLGDLEKINNKFTRSRSSVAGLLDFLEKQIASPTPFAGQNEHAKVLTALGKCQNPNDARLIKYHDAIKRMVGVWGTDRSYPSIHVASVIVTGNRDSDIEIARQVCELLGDIRIADVDFSENVIEHAKRKLIDGGNLYDFVHANYPAVQQQLEMVMTTEKANAKVHKTLLPLSSLGKIADSVKKYKFAVCESIAATVISDCKKKGFAGRLEWIGIVYTAITGHSIVVAHRQGNNLADIRTWGNYFIIDMWYYNLGMKDRYLWDGAARDSYYASEITRCKVIQMADV